MLVLRGLSIVGPLHLICSIYMMYFELIKVFHKRKKESCIFVVYLVSPFLSENKTKLQNYDGKKKKKEEGLGSDQSSTSCILCRSCTKLFKTILRLF